MSIHEVWRLWKHFWFEPTSPLPICIYRILFGLLILQTTIVHTLPAATFWYGPHAVIPLNTVKEHYWMMEPRLDAMLLLPLTDQSVYLFFNLFTLATVCLTIGFFTRQSAFLVALGMISFHHHQPYNINGGDAFLRLASIMLCFTDCGKYWSVDRIIRRLRKIPVSSKGSNPWAVRLLQVQFAIVYWQTFCCKVAGAQWLDGTAVYYATRLDDMLKFNLPFMNSLLFCKFLTVYTLVVEFSMWTLVWVREFRYYVLAAALILHFGIDLSINLPVFEWAFMATLVIFIEPEDLQRCLTKVHSYLFRQSSERSALSPVKAEIQEVHS